MSSSIESLANIPPIIDEIYDFFAVDWISDLIFVIYDWPLITEVSVSNFLVSFG